MTMEELVEDSDELNVKRRELLFDLVAQRELLKNPAVQESFGFVPASDDVLDAEHRAADRRAMAIMPYRERIELLSALAATLIEGSMESIHEAELSEEIRIGLVGGVVSSCVCAVLSDLLDKGYLDPVLPEA